MKGGTDLIPGLETKISHAAQCSQNIKKERKKESEKDMNSQFVALFWLLTFIKPNAQSQGKKRFVYGFLA